MKREILDALLSARADKLPVALLTRLSDGEQRLYGAGGDNESIDENLCQMATQVLQSDRSRTVSDADGDVFIQAFNPPLRLVVIGAVHITQALAPMATVAGYQVAVVDPRISFATQARFPGVQLYTDWPDEVLQTMTLDSRTAVITLTHDPKLDDPALHIALRAPVFYIGCLGSKRTHASRLERLRAAGFNDDEVARINAPLGLALGARSPAEIALSALAQLTSCLRGGSVR
jgi:xanthine dehydrogenase accessory factor